MAREVLESEGFTGEDTDIALGVGWWEPWHDGRGGYLDAVGDYKQLVDPDVAAKYGISAGWFQIRTLVDPTKWATYDRVRDIGVLAGRLAGTEQAPDGATMVAAARAQARAALVLVRARGWDLWTIYRTGKYLEHKGKDYPLLLGHPEANRWNLKGEPR